VEEVILYEMQIDEQKSDRDTIIISYINAGARVWVRFHADGKSNDSFYVRNDREFSFTYDADSKQYILSNNKEVKIFIV